jgi:hypothetical protein
MIIKRNVIFTLECRKKNNVIITENVPIRMRVIYNGKRIEFTTGYRIDASKWDKEKQRVRNGCSNKLKQSSAEINSDLLKYYVSIQDIFKQFEVKDVVPTIEQIKNIFNELYSKENTEDLNNKSNLFDSLDLFVNECGKQNNWTHATYEKFAAIKNHINNFNSNVTFNDFSEVGLNSYVDYLRDVKNMRNSTIEKQINYLKWFLRWTFKKGIHQNNAYDTFKPKIKNTPKKLFFNLERINATKTI